MPWKFECVQVIIEEAGGLRFHITSALRGGVGGTAGVSATGLSIGIIAADDGVLKRGE